MDGDGTRDARGTRRAVPRPASGPPPMPPVPPAPPGHPHVPQSSPVATWLDVPRADAEVGIWRFGHVPPRVPRKRKLAPASRLGALIPLGVGIVLWSLWLNNTFPYKGSLLALVTPGDWWYPLTLSPQTWQGAVARAVYDEIFFVVLLIAAGYLGSWPTLIRFWLGNRSQPQRAAITAAGAAVALVLVFPVLDSDPVPVYTTIIYLIALFTDGWAAAGAPVTVFLVDTSITLAVLWVAARWGDWRPLVRHWRTARQAGPRPDGAPVAVAPPSRWPLLRVAGQTQAADLLSADVLTGRMNDVDCARVGRAWDLLHTQGRLASFTETVLRHGGAAWTHPSGARDLPRRTTEHDLLVGQVRVGRCGSDERTPPAYRNAGVALDPATLGTSLLAVGPPGSGRTERLTVPVVESLALGALTGACAVVAVGTAGSSLGPDDAFDVVIRPGDPASVHDLHLYAEATDPDAAARSWPRAWPATSRRSAPAGRPRHWLS